MERYNTVFVVMIGVLVFGYLLERLLNALNLKHTVTELPEELKGIFDEEEYRKSQLYKRDNTRFSFVTSTLSTAVILVVFKQPGANTLALTRKVDAAVEKIRHALPPGVELRSDLFRQGTFLQRGVDNVIDALRDGAVGRLVDAELLLQLGDYRLDREVDAALDIHGVRAGSDHLDSLAEDGLGEHGGGRRSVTGNVRRLARHLTDELGAHVLGRILQLDLLGHGHTVLGGQRRAELLLQDHVPALGAKCDLHRVGQTVHAP